ncbi:MAG: exodeoxyribonuclease V subunit beta [Gammaproteobacteria bacterium]
MSAGAFDLYALPLYGRQLIEASAGTGKTYTITELYVRLLLESGRRVEEVLVVTYTQAATAELKQRIRDRIYALRSALDAADGTAADPVLARLADRQLAGRQLHRAERELDRAAIYTIHGFCQRMLAEYAFEGRVPFDQTLTPDPQRQALVKDYWRRETYRGSALFTAYLLESGHGLDWWLEQSRTLGHLRGLKRVGAGSALDCVDAEQRYLSAWQVLRALWPGSRERMVALLTGAGVLNRTRYPLRAVAGWMQAMEVFLENGATSLSGAERLDRFTPQALRQATRKGQATPEHAVFACCERLAAALAELRSAYAARVQEMLGRLLDALEQASASGSREDRRIDYEGLLSQFAQALESPRGLIAEAVRGRFTAALIDEFQDTDPLQYRIFQRLYGDTGLPVFLVGDPKQAIYSFRGADLFAYLAASRQTAQRHALDVNRRSVPGLVAALNALFQCRPVPFLFDEIPYHPVAAAADRHPPLVLNGQPVPAMALWWLPAPDTGLTKEEAAARAARATAGEIARLLSLGRRGELRIGERAVSGGDLAVLVRTHRQAETLRAALLPLGIACVQQGGEDVFQSAEAELLERVLPAVLCPGDPVALKSALATELFGWNATRIAALESDEGQWETQLTRFRRYREHWGAHGLMRMLRELLAEAQVIERWLRRPEGARRITNLLHLAELLQAQAHAFDLLPEALLRRLAARRGRGNRGEDEALLRLESDADRVKVLTVHAAKGLEFPIVLCPFLWDGRPPAATRAPVLYHDPADGYRATLDLGSAHIDAASRHAARESDAESLRLLYVALTRAIHRVYVITGHVHQVQHAALSRLLRPEDADAASAEFDPMVLYARLAALAAESHGDIELLGVPTAAAPVFSSVPADGAALTARVFRGRIAGGLHVSSFTALTRGLSPELPDYDERGPQAGTTPGPDRSILSFPRGARAGSCLHAILEHMDFRELSAQAHRGLVESQLLAHGIDQDWSTPLSEYLVQLMRSPLDRKRQLSLAQIERDERLAEMELCYPVRDAEHLQVPDGRGRDRRVAGAGHGSFMKGYVDLVFRWEGRFYLLDYKSNWLGPRAEDYRPERLATVMREEHYDLQYRIYTLGLHRYLQHRVAGYAYERHFGGVYYLFLRGVTGAGDTGVYFVRPQLAELAALEHEGPGGR